MLTRELGRHLAGMQITVSEHLPWIDPEDGHEQHWVQLRYDRYLISRKLWDSIEWTSKSSDEGGEEEKKWACS